MYIAIFLSIANYLECGTRPSLPSHTKHFKNAWSYTFKRRPRKRVGCSSSHLLLNTESYVLVTDNMGDFVKLLSFFTSSHSFHTKIPELSLLDHASLWYLKNKGPTWCHLLFYFTSYVLNTFWTLIYPSSGACDYSVELPHWSYCSWFDVCWSFRVVGLEWYPCCASACNTDTTPTQPHRNSNTHRTKNNTTNVVIQQNSSKLLMMDILMSETCWAHKKWNKIASYIKLVFCSSTIPELMRNFSYLRDSWFPQQGWWIVLS